jgi:hypothetical protein
MKSALSGALFNFPGLFPGFPGGQMHIAIVLL